MGQHRRKESSCYPCSRGIKGKGPVLTAGLFSRPAMSHFTKSGTFKRCPRYLSTTTSLWLRRLESVRVQKNTTKI